MNSVWSPFPFLRQNDHGSGKPASASLFRRHAALLVIIVLATQIVSLSLFASLLITPRARQVAFIIGDLVETLAQTADSTNVDQKAVLIDRLNATPDLRLLPVGSDPPALGRRLLASERIFIRTMTQRLLAGRLLDSGGSAHGIIWLQVEFAGEPRWISVRGQGGVSPFATFVLACLVISILAILSGLMLANQIVRPLRNLQAAADKLSLGRSPEPLEAGGPREIGALAESFNRMMRRLETAETDRNLVLAGVSHDLRTPLSKLRLALEMMPADDDLRASSIRQVERMDRLLRQFLDLARGFEAEPVRETDLSELVRFAVHDSGEAEVKLVVPDEPPIVAVRADALRRAIVNLIENAAAHGTRPIEIRLGAVAAGVSIAVRDHGSGMAPDLIPHAATPFRRGDATRSQGSGLGLAIVERIAILHGGGLRLSNHPGGGLEAAIDIKPAPI